MNRASYNGARFLVSFVSLVLAVVAASGDSVLIGPDGRIAEGNISTLAAKLSR